MNPLDVLLAIPAAGFIVTLLIPRRQENASHGRRKVTRTRQAADDNNAASATIAQQPTDRQPIECVLIAITPDDERRKSVPARRARSRLHIVATSAAAPA